MGGNSWAEKNVNINRKHSRKQRDGKETMPFLQMKNAVYLRCDFGGFFLSSLPFLPSLHAPSRPQVKLIFGPKT